MTVALVTAVAVVPSIAVLAAHPASAAPFTPGDVVVLRVGTGEAALGNTATATFLDEYTATGTLVRSTPLPTATAGANRRVTLSGSATSEGALSLSQDGRHLTLGGYDAAPGTAGVASTTTASVNRVVARVAGDGTVDSSTAVTDAFSGNNIRGATSADGGGHWAVGANGGVRYVPHGGGATTQLAASPTNIRTVTAAGGQLFFATGSGTTGVYTLGAGQPTTAGQTATLVAPAPSPYGVVALDRDPAVPGVDTLYVADDSAAPGGGVLKFSSDGSAWTAQGSFRPNGSGARGITGQVTPSGVTLFATTSTGTGALVRVDDSAAPAAPIAATGTTLRTGAANTALRGVAFAPAADTAPTAPSITTQPADATAGPGGTATLTVAASGTGPLSYQWFQGSAGDQSTPVGTDSASFTTPLLTASTSYWVRVSGPGGTANSRTASVTVSTAPNTAPSISPVPVPELAVTIGDPDNPPAVRTVDVADAQSPANGLTTTVTSADPAIATGGTTGTGATRTLAVNPVGVGHTTLTVTVSDGDLSAQTTFPVSVSAALPAGTHNHYGGSDASTAVDLGGGAMVVADDETNVLRVYDREHSRYPASSFDVRAAGLALRDSDVTREIDIEAAARRGDTIYWVGSQGQNSSAKTRLNRQELFTTTVTGTGTTATLALGGSYQKLRDDLIAWDNANGAALGLAAAATRAPEGDGSGPTGFNLEGAEFAPNGDLLLALRGPVTADGKAVVVPLTNPAALVAANPTTGTAATFGSALRWDLGGRGVREIRKNAANQYLVIAGPSDGGTGAAGEFKLYGWDGDATHQPVLRAGSLDAVAATGKPEAIVSVPDSLTDTSTIQVLADSGDTVFYGDGVIAKELPLAQRKSISATVTVGAAPACTVPVATIGSVQGSTDTSPKAGQSVTVRGTVVADHEGASPALRGFHLQDGGDGDPATSDGIFVFDNGADLVSNGDVVEVSGPISEFQGQTQLSPTAANVRSCGTRAPVTPTDVTLPRASAADLEPYEGMLVRLHQTLTVTEHFQLGRFGQVVVSSGGKLPQPTSIIPASDAAAVAARQNANNLNRLIIDDATQAQNPDPIAFGRGGQPLSAANTLRGGDTVTDAVGVLTYTWAGNAASGNAYRLRPIGALGGTATFDPVNERPTSRPDVGAGAVKTAGANLLNFFNTYTGCRFGTAGGPADCRGATSDTEYQRQLAKEVESLRFLDADVTGVMEIENDGYGPTSAIQALVDALNAADGPGSWAFVDADAATGVVDVAGTDAIKVALLYRPARVTPVAGATFVDQNPVFERRPVAQTFRTPAGARFTVTANHFKSKGSCPTTGPDTDQGDGQSCWNARRTQQANELANWLGGTVVPAAGDPDVLIVGDLNSYAGEDPITALAAAGYTNLAKEYQGENTYSYVFDGQWGYLDHALSSASLTPQVTGAGEAHHNADEPSVLDYNTDFKTPGQVASLYAPDRFRTSDHDPVLVGLDLGTAAEVSGAPRAGTVGAPYTHGFTLSRPAATTVSAGSLPPGLSLTESGTLVGVPTAAGDFAFTVRATNAYGSTEFATSLHVDRGAATVSVTAAPSPVATGGSVVLTATVAGPVPPTGTVAFTEGTTTLGTAELVDGTASITVPAAVGGHPVTAAYPGSADLLPATGTATYDGVDPVALSGTLPDGKVGTAYSATVPHTGGEPVALSVTAGTLPPGLTLSPAGALSGTPTTAGTHAFTVTATNAVSGTSREYSVVVAPATTTTVVTSSANPSVVGAAVRFTATVSGATGGTVQFAVDGRAFGRPVPVVGGKAVSEPISALGLGAHPVTAAYSGSTPSTGALTQSVQVGVKVLAPGATAQAGAVVPIRFQLTDASGRPLPLTSILLLLSGRVTVSASGAQSLAAAQPVYDLSTNTFVLPWKTAKKPAGPVTVSIKVTFPGVPDQVVPVPVVLK
ncbi:ExeM/NucH family extracellular endonuclease [Actinokineospora spheciospongiae]|uniref:ExeM/NucH family extracellular endonuclease n=1 Tax=Actinokineospora spheciospongiae TaxID=909613 RepID=UPI000DA0CE5D|nr:ExeM/NucH family extracellular endonuclease [Actinokineospora spheciospongiae]PWW59542.1 putative extracellular nuclease [Actinokineospora spheciospongiae]